MAEGGCRVLVGGMVAVGTRVGAGDGVAEGEGSIVAVGETEITSGSLVSVGAGPLISTLLLDRPMRRKMNTATPTKSRPIDLVLRRAASSSTDWSP